MTREEIITALENFNANPLTKEIIGEAQNMLREYQKTVTAEQNAAKEIFVAEGGKAEDFKVSRTQLDDAFDAVWATFNKHKKEFFAQLARQAEENLHEKESIIEEIEKLKQEENLKKAYTRFGLLQEKWKTIGLVPKEQYRTLHTKYSRARDEFFYTMHIYRELLENDLKKNFQLKQELVEKMKALVSMNNVREMEQMARQLTHDWNEVGPTFHDQWEGIRDAFWEAHHEVYQKVKDFFKSQKEVQLENLEKKKELLLTLHNINALKVTSEKKWRSLTKDVIQLQKDWKKIGFAPKSDNDKIWKEFKTEADTFFKNKSAFYLEIKKEHDLHKEAKEKIVSEAESLKTSEDWGSTSKKLTQLQKRWKQVGPAHHRDEQRLWKRFRAACNEFFDNKKKHFETLENSQGDNLLKKKAVLDEISALKPSEGNNKLEPLTNLVAEFHKIGFVPLREKQPINMAFKKAVQEKLKEFKLEQEEINDYLFGIKIEELATSATPYKSLEREAQHLREKIKSTKAIILQYENNLGFFGHSKGAEALKKEVEAKLNHTREQLKRHEKKLNFIYKQAKN